MRLALWFLLGLWLHSEGESDERNSHVQALTSAAGFEKFVARGACSGPRALFFGTREDDPLLVEFHAVATEVQNIACLGFVNCGDLHDLCVDLNLRRKPAVMFFPLEPGAAHLHLGTLDSSSVATGLVGLISANSRVELVTADSVNAFLNDPRHPTKLLLFSSRKTPPVILQSLSGDPELWPHVSFGFVRPSENGVMAMFGVKEVPLIVLQYGSNSDTRRTFDEGMHSAGTYGALRRWLMQVVEDAQRHFNELPFEEDPAGPWADADDSAQVDPTESISSTAQQGRGTAYTRLAYGEASCPPGFEILSVDECVTALSVLDIEAMPAWVSVYTGLPRFCSVRENTGTNGKERMHFNSATTGQGRSDLAPVCKSQPEDMRVSELSGQSAGNLLGQGLNVIYLRSGRLTEPEVQMLLSLEERFAPYAARAGLPLRWMWLDVRLERKVKSLFDPPTFPSAVVTMDTTQFALVTHEERDDEYLPAGEAAISQLLENVFDGKQVFTILATKKLNAAWSSRGVRLE